MEGNYFMNVHLLVDFMYLFYKYKFTIESNRIRRLTSTVECIADDGTVQVQQVDMSKVYYPLKEIEGFRREFEGEGHNVTMSICFDSPSIRKNINAEYKSNRVNKLTDDDFEKIAFIRELLDKAGYNVYYIEGYEADDIIANLLHLYRDNFDFNVVYTPDTDLAVHLSDKVGIMRYKAGKNYVPISVKNVQQYISQEFKCNIPPNGLLLYKVLCGDKSDAIKGLKGFGPVAFNTYIGYIKDKVDWTQMNDINYVRQVILDSNYFDEVALRQIDEALSMVRYMEIESLEAPVKVSTQETRASAYLPYQMKSLVE